VVFLDTQLRIRRFTPAARKLFDVIDTDLGRPLAHFTKRFTDTRLLEDAQHVLDRLAPISMEVHGESDRWYVRSMTAMLRAARQPFGTGRVLVAPDSPATTQ